MPDKLSIFAFATSSVAVAVVMMVGLPSRPTQGPEPSKLTAQIEVLEGDVQRMSDARRALADLRDVMDIELNDVGNDLDRLEPGSTRASPDDRELREAARLHVGVLVNSVRINHAEQSRIRVINRIKSDVRTRLKLNELQNQQFGLLLDGQYESYRTSVMRYGRDTDRVTGDYRKAREKGNARLAEILTADQVRRWKAEHAGWHAYLKVLFTP